MALKVSQTKVLTSKFPKKREEKMSEVMSGFKKHNLTTSINAKHTLNGPSSYKTFFSFPWILFSTSEKKDKKNENEVLVIAIIYKQDPTPLPETTERESKREWEG